jgi:hypothetical protein
MFGYPVVLFLFYFYFILFFGGREGFLSAVAKVAIIQRIILGEFGYIPHMIFLNF